MNQKQLALHLLASATRANPELLLERLQVLQKFAIALEIPEPVAFAVFKNASKQSYLQEIAAHAPAFEGLDVPAADADAFFDIFADEFQYAPQDNVRAKD